MGKSSKVRVTRSVHDAPLGDTLQRARYAQPSKRAADDTNDDTNTFLDERISRRILQNAKKQQAELEEEIGVGNTSKGIKLSSHAPSVSSSQNNTDHQSDQSEPESDSEETCGSIPAVVENISPEDEAAMAQFIKPREQNSGQKTLYDMIMSKLSETRDQIGNATQQPPGPEDGLDERVVRVYKQVGVLLSKYRGAANVPKALKVLPSLENWEQLLFLMNPHEWTAAAMYQATRRFASVGNDKVCQRFYNLILLPRVRDDISEYKRLNYHLYVTIKKAMYKIGPFFRGFLLPLCEEGDCTLREAVIISSVIAKCSIPVLHSSAAMLKIAEMHYSGANSIFLKTFFNKKYSLPFRVIDATVFHFLSFMDDAREFPVLWHQCLLTFVQRYRDNLSKEQKEQLMRLGSKHFHDKITPEIHRELQYSLNKFTDTSNEVEMNSIS